MSKKIPISDIEGKWWIVALNYDIFLEEFTEGKIDINLNKERKIMKVDHVYFNDNQNIICKIKGSINLVENKHKILLFIEEDADEEEAEKVLDMYGIKDIILDYKYKPKSVYFVNLEIHISQYNDDYIFLTYIKEGIHSVYLLSRSIEPCYCCIKKVLKYGIYKDIKNYFHIISSCCH